MINPIFIMFFAFLSAYLVVDRITLLAVRGVTFFDAVQTVFVGLLLMILLAYLSLMYSVTPN